MLYANDLASKSLLPRFMHYRCAIALIDVVRKIAINNVPCSAVRLRPTVPKLRAREIVWKHIVSHAYVRKQFGTLNVRTGKIQSRRVASRAVIACMPKGCRRCRTNAGALYTVRLQAHPCFDTQQLSSASQQRVFSAFEVHGHPIEHVS